MAWKEYYVYSLTFTNLVAGTGATFTDNELRIDTDSPFEFVKTMFNPVTAAVRVQYRDDTTARFLQKGSQDLRTIGGFAHFSVAPGSTNTPPGFVPFIWPRPYIIPPATTFTVQAADFSGIQRTLRMSFHGSKLRPGKAPWDKKYKAMVPYVYPLPSPGTVTISASGSTSAAIVTDNDAHFLIYKIVGARTGSCTLTVKDGARDRQWMNTATHFDNFVGNGQFPNILPSPRFIPRGSIVAITLNDLSGASNVVEFNLIGVKLYE